MEKDKSKMSNWNIRTHKVNIAIMQKIRQNGQGELNKKGFTFFCAGHQNEGQYCVDSSLWTNQYIIEWNLNQAMKEYMHIKIKCFSLSVT